MQDAARGAVPSQITRPTSEARLAAVVQAAYILEARSPMNAFALAHRASSARRRSPSAAARARLPRAVHGDPRHLDRQRRAAGHPLLARLLRHRPAVGRQRLHAHLRRLPDACRPRHRPPPPPPGLPGRRLAVLGRLARLRARRQPGRPRRRPRDPGLRRRGDLRRQPRDRHGSFKEGVERNRALGLWAAMGGVGASPGVLLGGALTQALSWPAVFIINIPVGIAVSRWRRADPEGRAALGTASSTSPARCLMIGGLTAIVYGIVRTDSLGWGSLRRAGPAGARLRPARPLRAGRGQLANAPLIPLDVFKSGAAGGQPDRRPALRRHVRHVVLRLPLPAGSERRQRAARRRPFLPMTLLVLADRAAKLVARFGSARR